jgi:HPt (histidine-containing phosphotransfer) domain-containing protein
MRPDVGEETGGRSALPDVQVSLRQAFAGEVAARLPRLEALRDGDAEDHDAAVRDAHTLASSAVIIGEPQIAELARAVEDDPVGGPVDDLVEALRGWSP